MILPWLLVAVLCWLFYQLVRQNGRILLHLEALDAKVTKPSPPARTPAKAPSGLSPGSSAPDFELPDLAGTTRRLRDWRGRRLVLIFFNTRCGFCQQMAPRLAALDPDGGDGRPVPLLIAAGSPDDNRSYMDEHGIRCPVLVQEGQGELAAKYQAGGTPMGYLIDEDGRIATPLTVGADALLALADVPAAPPAKDAKAKPQEPHGATKGKANRGLHTSRLRRDGLKAGETAPAFRLPRIDGGELALEDYRGRRVLLVFSDPECGPCMEVAPKIEQLHRDHPGVAVVMVSRRDSEANRQKAAQLGLTFPIVLQKQWEVSLQFAMFATPIAYLIDEQGVLAADVAVGPEPIKGLLVKALAAQGPDRGAPDGNGVVAQTAT
jgi:peroxiredoxin